MVAFVGRDVVAEFAIGAETADPKTLTFKRLGMVRAKGLEVNWETTDTTADTSPSYTKTSLVTFKEVKVSMDGVTYTDDGYNLNEFEQQVVSPSAGTNYQPKVWVRFTYPDKVYQGPFIVSSYKNDAPYDGAATWSCEASSNGDVTLTPL